MELDNAATQFLIGALLLVGAILGLIAKSIRESDPTRSELLPSDPVHVDLSPVLRQIAEAEERVRQDVAAFEKQALERLTGNEKQIIQVVQSMSDTLSRQHREKEIEDRRQHERTQDKIDRLRNGKPD